MHREFNTRHHHDDPTEGPEPGLEDSAGQRGSGRGRRHHGGGRGRRGQGGPGFGPDGPGGPFGAGSPRGRRRRPKGAVREAILALLADGPANGYGLMKRIAERAEGQWSPSPGSVYPTLAQLVDEGLIAPAGTEKGTDYTLTEAGQSYVTENAEALAEVWGVHAQGAPAQAAMRASLEALFGVVQQFRFAATDTQRERAVQTLDDARRTLYRILGE